jgi:hypothetical protein
MCEITITVIIGLIDNFYPGKITLISNACMFFIEVGYFFASVWLPPLAINVADRF